MWFPQRLAPGASAHPFPTPPCSGHATPPPATFQGGQEGCLVMKKGPALAVGPSFQPSPDLSLPACLSLPVSPTVLGPQDARSFHTFLGSFTISSSSVLSLFSILKPLGSASPSPPNTGSEHLKGTQRTCHLTLGTCYWATFSAPPLQNQTKTANRKRSSFKNYSIIIK